MLVSTGILIGAATFAGYALVTNKILEKKLDRYKLVIDPATSKIYIKCSARGIPYENFKVYTRIEHSQVYLFTKGAAVTENNDAVKVEHKYLLKNVPMKDLQQMTWSINADAELVVEIPLSDVSRKMHIKRIT